MLLVLFKLLIFTYLDFQVFIYIHIFIIPSFEEIVEEHSSLTTQQQQPCLQED
jgi:hypothetical protein